MHETRTNLQRKAANAARAKSERRLVADELKDDASSDDDAHGADSAPCEYNARRRPRSAAAARRANDSAARVQRKPAHTAGALSALMRNVPTNCLSEKQEMALARISHGLAQRLAPFLTDTSVEHWSPFEGLVIDLGTVNRSREYHARIDVRNISPNFITVDSVAPRDGALASVASTSYVPGQVAPGLTRIIDVKISPANGNAYANPEVADFIDIRVGALRVSVPLYYRVCKAGGTNTSDDRRLP